MKLSTKGRYGLRALVDLAVNGEQEAVSVGSIAERQEISERYLEQLMGKLRRAGIVKSTRGARGGYALAKPASQIVVGDVLRALEGTLEPIDCPGLLGKGECAGSDVCATKYVWKRINEGVTKIVDEITLQSILDGQENMV